MQYTIDFENQAYLLLPPFLRKPKIFSFVSALLYPLLISLSEMFCSFRDNNTYELKFNGQTLSLEKILNERFDGFNEAIYIEDNEDSLPGNFIYLLTEVPQTEQLYLWSANEIIAETPPEALPIYLYSNEEYLAIPDFIVWVLTDTWDDITNAEQIPYFETTINRRKIAGKKYTIKTYNL